MDYSSLVAEDLQKSASAAFCRAIGETAASPPRDTTQRSYIDSNLDQLWQTACAVVLKMPKDIVVHRSKVLSAACTIAHLAATLVKATFTPINSLSSGGPTGSQSAMAHLLSRMCKTASAWQHAKPLVYNKLLTVPPEE